MTQIISNAIQEYTYSLKSVAFSSTSIGMLCSSEQWFQVYPPDDYIELKRLRFHIILLFDSGITVPNQMVNKIGITDSKITGLTDATYSNLLTLNRSADASRRLDLNIELTSLLKRSPNNNYYVYMKFPTTYTTSPNGGKVLLCKADALFTTTGIR